ncbi:MAG: Diadenosine tetraphosphate (Ap4A) hydrolase related family hydrolase, Hit-like protein involved [Parcubacteria group bacterium]|nr:Diadenosine tetraphosphate (Ap4A) hydrolase related family hydrolase, Hit-like protein involved [Parcubacteria group bacterium]
MYQNEVSCAHMEDSIFMKIIRREIPAEIIYEDDETLAFLDIAPVSPGHTLVIPKKQVTNIFDTDDATLCAVMNTVRKIAPAVRDAVGADALNINSNHGADAGQIVFHMHIHLIPRFKGDNFVMWPHKEYQKGEAEAVAEKIRAKLA